MTKLLNLNADLGESFGAWKMGSDSAMLGIVKSANVACGFHAGDPTVMLKTAALARDNGVSIGAHPGFPDLQGFGRRRMDIPLDELEAMMLYQIGALEACARAQGMRTMREDGVRKVLAGLTTIEEVLAVTVGDRD